MSVPSLLTIIPTSPTQASVPSSFLELRFVCKTTPYEIIYPSESEQILTMSQLNVSALERFPINLLDLIMQSEYNTISIYLSIVFMWNVPPI